MGHRGPGEIERGGVGGTNHLHRRGVAVLVEAADGCGRRPDLPCTARHQLDCRLEMRSSHEGLVSLYVHDHLERPELGTARHFGHAVGAGGVGRIGESHGCPEALRDLTDLLAVRRHDDPVEQVGGHGPAPHPLEEWPAGDGMKRFPEQPGRPQARRNHPQYPPTHSAPRGAKIGRP